MTNHLSHLLFQDVPLPLSPPPPPTAALNKSDLITK